ncbi:beta-N-acetylhexosaminidase [Thalassotalea sp. 1_MG-2023]|uniref:beta-N-acetylhexosaminidase n=1 Tax=Thalassotalea sp. 1_MG-2023 TaxID=3062680 RepID=UPI0026E1E251|nr:beta-N-acetylhexosaminidase [Thalassotalea sp. 1_MG-2023]MDO6428461.1 beta-N-acetylhexosaminidase [Thalassotalea sp. 1_MG-2023]
MKYLITLFFILLQTPVFSAQQSTPVLFPYPEKVTWHKEHFKVNRHTSFYANDERARKSALLFSKKIQPTTGYLFPFSDQLKSNQVRFIIDTKISHDEGYTLEVLSEVVTLKASSEKGLFYASQTLRQLLNRDIETKTPINRSFWPIQGVTITDKPAFKYRGMHLDVSRHFYDIDFIKKYIDWLSHHKFNKFQWHLTDDQGWRIEINAYPKLTEIGSKRSKTVVGHTYDYQPIYDDLPHRGFYTQAQIKEVVEYAKQKHVEIIPEIDIPGHSTAIIAAYPELSCHGNNVNVESHFGIFEQVLCPSNKTMTFLASVYREVADLFPSKYIHIGGDEVIKKQWLQSAQVQSLMQDLNITTGEQLQSYFIHQVTSILTSLGKTAVGWDEILEGGAPNTALITSWRGTEGGIQAAKRGNNVVMTPYQFTYFDAYQSRSIEEPKAIHGFLPIEKVYQFQVVPEQLTPEQSRHIIGVQGALWTEYIKTEQHVQYMIFPRIAALAEVAWSTNKSWQRFSKQLDRLTERYHAMGVNSSDAYLVPWVEKVKATSNKVDILFSQLNEQRELVVEQENKKNGEKNHLFNSVITVSDAKLHTIKAYTQSDDNQSKPVQITVAPHKTIHKKITFKYAPAKNTEHRINDGIFAYDQYYDVNNFTVFQGVNLDAVINFNQKEQVSRVVFGIDAGRHRQLVPPESIEIHSSVDGNKWQLVKLLSDKDINGPLVDIRFTTINTQFLRVVAINKKQSLDPQIPLLPLYVDEIAVF